MKKELNIKKLILLIMLISLIWAGGYYEYTSAILGGFVMVCFVYAFVKVKGDKKRSSKVELNSGIIFSEMLTLFYGVSIFYATDSGMAFIGSVKKCSILIFAAIILLIDKKERKSLLQMLPHMASIICLTGLAGSVFFKNLIIKNGRFSGTIGYANTFALIMLLGIITAVLKLNKKDIINSIELIIMFAGLWFSGSRFTMVLFIIIMIMLIFHISSGRIRIAVSGIVVAMGVVFAVLFNSLGIAGRIFSDNLSTMYGRFLYWQDALKLLIKHPFGMGYLGYYYEQTQIQTGVYTVRYVHNDILQMALDIGIIPVCIIFAVFILALLNRERDYIEKILIFTILAHCIFEFDFEHTAVMFIFVLLLSCSDEKIYEKFNVPADVFKYRAVVFGLVCVYMALPLSFYAAGNIDAALKTYPVYTDAYAAKLSETQDMDEGEKIAKKLLKQNETVSLAYSALAQAACQEGKIDKVAEYEKKAIERNKFDKEQYVEYLYLLNDMLGNKKIADNDKLTGKIIKKMKEVPGLIEKNRKTVSKLGKKINDKVDIELDKELLKEIQEL